MSQFVKYISEQWPAWLCVGILFPLVGYLYRQVLATRRGIRALLRADLIRMYNKYKEDLEYCPIYVKTALEDEYKQYHAIGGNGVITKLYEELMALPTEPKEGRNG